MNEFAEKEEEKVWYKNTSFYLWCLGIFLFLVVVVPPIVFYCNLHENGKSYDPEKWGQYGDFIGGISNPILAAINIGVLVYLSITIHNNEKKRHEDDLKSQKAIALNGFRHEAYIAFKNHINAFDKLPATFVKLAISYHDLWAYVDDFKKSNGYLFEIENFSIGISNLKNTTNEIAALIENFDSKGYHTPSSLLAEMDDNKNVVSDPEYIQYEKLLTKHHIDTVEMMRIMQSSIMSREYEPAYNREL